MKKIILLWILLVPFFSQCQTARRASDSSFYFLDTTRAILLCADTSVMTKKGKWYTVVPNTTFYLFGYHIAKWEWVADDELVQPHVEITTVGYLDEYKREFNKNIVIWDFKLIKSDGNSKTY